MRETRPRATWARNAVLGGPFKKGPGNRPKLMYLRDYMPEEPVVAIALLTQTNLRMLKGSLKKVFPITQDKKFEALLKALDRIGTTDPREPAGRR